MTLYLFSYVSYMRRVQSSNEVSKIADEIESNVKENYYFKIIYFIISKVSNRDRK